MLRLKNIKIPLQQIEKFGEASALRKWTYRKLQINESGIKNIYIYKKSLDARKNMVAANVYTLDVEVEANLESEILSLKIDNVALTPNYTYQGVSEGVRKLRRRPLVIGFGPAGMFAALLLAQRGYRPIIIERGSKVEKRLADVETFWQSGVLNPNSNVQFGEGGAGTFSDGKLTTRVKDERIHKVLDELVLAGANPNIKLDHMPHIGSDCLVDIVRKIREQIIDLGGTFHFDTLVEDIVVENNKITGVITKKGIIHTNQVVLAIGHSARDTFFKLHEHQVKMEAKPFAIGVRIEHPQVLINENQYQGIENQAQLEAASYRLTYQASNNRGVYSFCMCPGGVVVPSTSNAGCIVTNGMSYAARDNVNANAGILVQVGPKDFGEDILDGIRFQESIERKAFELAKNTYKAPCQLASDYLLNKTSTEIKHTKPSYMLGVELCDLNSLFPPYINKALKEGLNDFDRKIPGFISQGILTGPETRSSSPLRINRHDDSLQSLSIKGLYPCGEGAGYAGGIVSAAIDGIRVSEAIIKEYAPLNQE